MDYFKHYSTAAEGNTLNHLMDKFGHQGYACWFLLLELCCANWDGKSEPKFNFFSTIVRKKLRISSTKLQVFLEYCSTISELSFNFSEKNLEISLPMLAEIKETRGRISGNKPKKFDIYRIEKEKEEDKEKEKFISDISSNQNQSNQNSSYTLKPRTDSKSEWPQVKPDQIIQLFNDMLAGKAGKIKFCRGLGNAQIKDFITTISYQDFQSTEIWKELFEKVSQSPFLSGIQEGSTFVATLDWLINRDNALKVLSGKYPAKNEESPSNKFANLELN